jgi:hypothetical protein
MKSNSVMDVPRLDLNFDSSKVKKKVRLCITKAVC